MDRPSCTRTGPSELALMLVIWPMIGPIIGLTIGLTITTDAWADDWTRWRGPKGDGISHENGWQAQTLKRPSSIAWKTNVGKGHSTVVVKGDRVYTAGNREISSAGSDNAVYEEVVYCLDTGNGRVVWRYSYPTEDRDYPGPGATPLVDGDNLYMVSRGGDVYCFEAANGKVVWKRNLVADGLAAAPGWGFCSSPVVDGDLLVLNAGRAGLALDKRTGKVVWSSEPVRGGLPTPVFLDLQGKRIAAIVSAGKLSGVDVKTGKVLWTYDWHSDADPVALGSRLYLKGGFRGNGHAMLDLSSGTPELLWEDRGMATTHTTSVIIGNHAYGFGRVQGKPVFTCVDLGSGEIAWSTDMGDYSALMASGDKLLIVDVDGDLIIAKASPDGYQVVASRKVIDMRYVRTSGGDRNACWSAPVLANGKIYARSSHGDLSCVDIAM